MFYAGDAKTDGMCDKAGKAIYQYVFVLAFKLEATDEASKIGCTPVQ